MAYIYDLSDAWANGATTFTAIKMSVTDTASAAGSLLMDLQVGGSSRFNVTKVGALVLGTAAANTAPNDYSNTGITMAGGAGFFGYAGGIGAFAGSLNKLFYAYDDGGGGRRFTLLNGTVLGFRADGGTAAPDTILARDAANTLAQRNGVNAQAFNLYNTYTDASNYERGFMRFVSNVLEIGTQAAGTGTGRSISILRAGVAAAQFDSGYFGLYNGSGARTVLVNTTSGQFNTLTGGRYGFGVDDSVDAHINRAAAAVVGIGGAPGAAGAMQMVEMTAPAAPATNGVRIYAEDNGSGKTRLMALFATGAAQQIVIEP